MIQRITKFLHKIALLLGSSQVLPKIITKIGPFIMGPLAYGLPIDSTQVSDSIKRFLTFVVLTLSWQLSLFIGLQLRQTRVARLKAISNGTKEQDLPPGSSAFVILKFIVVSLVAIFTLEAFRNYFGAELFYFVIILMTISVLSKALELGLITKDRKPLLALSGHFIYWSGVAFLSFYSLSLTFRSELITLSGAFGALACSINSLWYIYDSKATTDYIKMIRSGTIICFTAPILIGILVYSGNLRELFLALFVPWISVVNLPERWMKCELRNLNNLIAISASLISLCAIIFYSGFAIIMRW